MAVPRRLECVNTDLGARSLELLNELQSVLGALIKENESLRSEKYEGNVELKSGKSLAHGTWYVKGTKPPTLVAAKVDSGAGMSAVASVDFGQEECAEALPLPLSPREGVEPQPCSPAREPLHFHRKAKLRDRVGRSENSGRLVRKFSKTSLGSEISSRSSMSSFAAAESCIARTLKSRQFECAVGALILLNTLIMTLEIQYYGLDAGYRANFPDIEEPAAKMWPYAEFTFVVCERVFTTIFTIELAVRIAVFRCQVFTAALNWIDVVSVVAGLLDWVSASGAVLNPMMARLLRLAKLARGLRLAKMSTVLDSLNLLLKCISASVVTLSWSVLLLLTLQCITGMIMSQLVREIILDPDLSPEARHTIYSYYGTFSRSQITMFEVHLANFAPACRVLVDYCGEWYAIIFLAYRCLAGYAVLNVINAVFIQQTISIAQRDHDILLRQKQKTTERYAKGLRQIFDEIDTSGDGKISPSELRALSTRPELQLWMNALEIDTSDLSGLFDLLDLTGDRIITFDEFLESAMRIKGTAKSIDVLSILSQLKSVGTKLDTLLKPSGSSFSRQNSPFANSNSSFSRLSSPDTGIRQSCRGDTVELKL